MTLFLGKLPAKDGSFPHKFGTLFSASDLPTPPPVFGRVMLIPEWGMLGNDQAGNCVECSAAHQNMQWHALAGTPIPQFTSKTTLSDYSAATGYVPGQDNTDNGTDMGAFATYWKTTGIIDATGSRHKIDLSVDISPGNTDQIALACFLFDSVDIGVNLPSSAMDQFTNKTPWAPVAGSSLIGGHCVTIIGRNSLGNFICVSWGELQAITPSFLTTYMDQGAVHLSLDQFNSKQLNPRGYNLAALTAAASAI
jgi:hypothetical protein